MKRVLFFGDVVAKPGRKAIAKILPELRSQYNPDLVVANIENMAHGKGVTLSTMEDLAGLGIDVFTSGNHIFKKPQTEEVFAKYPNLIRPANYGNDFPGRGFFRLEKEGQGYLVVNLNATVFFESQFEGPIANPFFTLDQILADQKKEGDIVLVDFHSEATSEKAALAWYSDGRATMVFGTHTHVPTADLRILPKGTAFVSDVGMIGSLNSVLGVTPESSIAVFLGGKFAYQTEESNPISVNAVYVEAEDGRAVKVEKIYREINIDI